MELPRVVIRPLPPDDVDAWGERQADILDIVKRAGNTCLYRFRPGPVLIIGFKYIILESLEYRHTHPPSATAYVVSSGHLQHVSCVEIDPVMRLAVSLNLVMRLAMSLNPVSRRPKTTLKPVTNLIHTTNLRSLQDKSRDWMSHHLQFIKILILMSPPTVHQTTPFTYSNLTVEGSLGRS
ncbi:hypothetical protein YC2023_073435 [Brassica napus]